MLRGREKAWTKLKVCAIGEEAVGKTSLIRRFVSDEFLGEYTRTIGTHLSKKTVTLKDDEGDLVDIDAIIWDIMGRRSFANLTKDAYFTGAKGIFAVCDITRRGTLGSLHAWLLKVFSAIGIIPVVIMVNKSDLEGHYRVRRDDMMKFTETYGSPYFLTSAKTGDGVSEAFEDLMKRILQQREGGEGPAE